MRRLRALAVGLAFLLLSSACTSNGAEEPAPIPNDEPDGSAAPADSDGEAEDEGDEIDVTTVPSDPEDIDVEYVQAVMDEINPIIQAAVVLFREVEDVQDANLREVMFSAYTKESGTAQLETLGGLRADRVKSNPGAPTAEVQEILELQDGCIVFSAIRTWRPIMTEDVEYNPVQPYYLRLVPNEPNELNATAWQLDFDGYLDNPDQEPEGDVCEG